MGVYTIVSSALFVVDLSRELIVVLFAVECFQCSQCNHRFCIGDRFHLYDNRILCEYDYEDLAMMEEENNNNLIDSSNPLASGLNFHSHIDKLKKQTDSLPPPNHSSSSSSSSAAAVVHALANDEGSSGYGSPDSLLSDGK